LIGAGIDREKPMQHVITTGTAASPELSGQWLSGYLDSGDACAIRIIAIGGEAGAPDLRSCGVDRTLFILSGSLNLRIGMELHRAPKHAFILLPAGTPHAVWAAEDRADCLEVFAPAPAGSIFSAADARKIDNAGALVRPLLQENFTKGGFAYQTLADRGSGSEHLRVNVVEVQPGSGSPDFHIHAFDQYYYVLSGQMHVEIGKKTIVAPTNSLVHLPAGLVHRNYNLGPDVERHVTLIVPEPRDGEVFDFACDVHDHEAKIMQSAPGWTSEGLV
jgi:quercetin dioxygenase-like cupin family protein